MKTIEITEQDEATYRVLLKRVIRATGLQAPNDKAFNTSATELLEEQFKKLAKELPRTVAKAIADRFEWADREWERGNNSGDSDTLTKAEIECDRLRGIGERAMALFGVTCSYPGLYPCFHRDGFTEYTALGAIQRLSA
jgi:hypothetical protein